MDTESVYTENPNPTEINVKESEDVKRGDNANRNENVKVSETINLEDRIYSAIETVGID